MEKAEERMVKCGHTGDMGKAKVESVCPNLLGLTLYLKLLHLWTQISLTSTQNN